MPVETPSLFAKVIQDHLALRERNSSLENAMPLERYKSEDPFENHPLFKTEEQARLEETMDGDVIAHIDFPAEWPDEVASEAKPEEDTLWGKSRDFDWGD
jgi:hypothetical protein